MKITYLHQYFNTPDMPGGTRSYEMARRLVAMGHEVNMITSWREADGRTDWFETKEAGIKVHWVPVPYSNYMGFGERICAFLKFAIASARKAASLPADIVFATSTPLTIALPAVYASRRRKVPMVFEVRDLWPQVPIALGALRNPLMKWVASALENWAYKHSDAIVALAPGMKAGVVRRGVRPQRVGVIPNGADNFLETCDKETSSGELAGQYGWLRSRPVLLYAGTFGFVNDLDFMVRLAVVMRTSNPEVCFVAIGDGAQWLKIENLATKLGVLNRNFFLLGKKPKQEVYKWLVTADAHLVLYRGPKIVWEDCVSNKLFDAMAAGKPIISNISGWGPLIAESVGAAIVLDSADLDKSARVIDKKITDIHWMKEASLASKKLANETFNRDKQSKQLEQVLLAVKNGKSDSVEKIAPGVYIA